MGNRILFVATTFLAMASGLLYPWVPEAQGQSSSWDLPELKEAEAALARRDCKTAWEIYWSFASTGNAEARYALAASMLVSTLPPGISIRPSSLIILFRHSLTLSAYGALAHPHPGMARPDHQWIRDAIPVYLKQ